MYITSFTAISLLVAAMAAPSPAPAPAPAPVLAADLAKRACSKVYQPTKWSINSQSPYPGSPSATQILIYRGSGPTKGFTDTLVEFKNIPQTATGCQFELDYQPGHGASFYNEKGEADRVDVYQIIGSIPDQPTWQNVAPITGSNIGTFRFPTGDALNYARKIVLSNSACAPTMRFRLSMNTEALGYISSNDDGSSGLRIVHNC